MSPATSKSTATDRPKADLPPLDSAPHILIIDDDRRIRELLRSFLSEHGFRVTTAASAVDARKRMDGLSFDLLVLDVMMPGETGLQLAESIRQDSTIPIVMLTALAETENRVAGLETGVDDYLAKPFEPRELVLRINNILRYHTAEEETVETIAMGPCSFNIARGELKRHGTTVRLTTRERDLLRIFAMNKGKTVTRSTLSPGQGAAGARAVDVQINRLRRKIEPDPAAPVYLQTVRGAGYILYAD